MPQEEWKKRFFETVIQKIYRSHYFRTLYQIFNKGKNIIYKKKKINNEINKNRFSLRRRSCDKGRNNDNKLKLNNSEVPCIKTIIIKSFNRPKIITNYRNLII